MTVLHLWFVRLWFVSLSANAAVTLPNEVATFEQLLTTWVSPVSVRIGDVVKASSKRERDRTVTYSLASGDALVISYSPIRTTDISTPETGPRYEQMETLSLYEPGDSSRPIWTEVIKTVRESPMVDPVADRLQFKGGSHYHLGNGEWFKHSKLTILGQKIEFLTTRKKTLRHFQGSDFPGDEIESRVVVSDATATTKVMEMVEFRQSDGRYADFRLTGFPASVRLSAATYDRTFEGGIGIGSRRDYRVVIEMVPGQVFPLRNFTYNRDPYSGLNPFVKDSTGNVIKPVFGQLNALSNFVVERALPAIERVESASGNQRFINELLILQTQINPTSPNTGDLTQALLKIREYIDEVVKKGRILIIDNRPEAK